MLRHSVIIALLVAVGIAPGLGCNKGGQAQQAGSTGSDPASTAAQSPQQLPQEPAEQQAQQLGTPLLLWTDPALRPVLQQLNARFKTQYAPGFSATQLDKGELLARLPGISDGSAAEVPDVYLFTGKEVQDALLGAGALDAVSLRSFAGDRLVLVCRPEDTYEAPTLFDVSKLRFRQLALADPARCMLGVFTEQAIITDGLKPRVDDRLALLASSDELISGVLEKRLDVAIVYASGAAQTEGLRLALAIDESLHEDIVWKAAAARGRSAEPAVTALLRLLAEDPEVQQQYEAYGFTRRDVAMVEDK